MPQHKALKLLFIVNKSSGKNSTDWQTTIRNHYRQSPHQVTLFEMPESCCTEDIERQLEKIQPDRVVAVGGDGTIKLVAQCCMKTHTPLGIVPAGSANGMAKELKIPQEADKALDTVVDGHPLSIHLTRVNDELCIHLCDIGFNAFVIKKFDTYGSRGMWGYVKAAWAVLRSHSRMEVNLNIDGAMKCKEAAMVVIANATQYGSGALINPKGDLQDDLFEIVIVKKVSFGEIFKMIFTHQPYDPAKTEIYQTHSVQISSKKEAHFQVDGEYLGKINALEATILPEAVQVIVPAAEAGG